MPLSTRYRLFALDCIHLVRYEFPRCIISCHLIVWTKCKTEVMLVFCLYGYGIWDSYLQFEKPEYCSIWNIVKTIWLFLFVPTHAQCFKIIYKRSWSLNINLTKKRQLFNQCRESRTWVVQWKSTLKVWTCSSKIGRPSTFIPSRPKMNQGRFVDNTEWKTGSGIKNYRTLFHFIWPDLNTRKLGEHQSTVRRDTTTRTTRVAGKSYTTLAFSQLTTCLDQAI